MALKNFILPAFLGCVFLYFGYVLCDDPKLTPYGKKVKSVISDDTYNKTFSANAKDDDQFKEAIVKGTKNFYKVFGLEYNEKVEEAIEKESEDIGYKQFTSDVLFHSQTFALGKCLRELHKLNNSNIDNVAQTYVDKLDAAAKDVTDPDDIVQTFVAQTTGVANLLKDEGVTSKEDLDKCNKYFGEELKKYAKKDS